MFIVGICSGFIEYCKKFFFLTLFQVQKHCISGRSHAKFR